MSDSNNEIKPIYIMTPDLFNQLCYVSGFNRMNGNTYQEHIEKIFGDLLNDNEIVKIRGSKDSDEALDILKNLGVTYTHSMEEQW